MPSARFRIRQHIAPLRALQVDVKDHCPWLSQHARLPGALGSIRQRYLLPVAMGQVLLNAALRAPGVVGTYQADLTWIERNFIPGLDAAVGCAKAPRLLDVDDAIWLSTLFGQSAAKRLAGRVDAVVAGNSYLADWYGNYCNKIFVIPTAIDCDRFAPGRAAPGDPIETDRFTIGWTGTAGNFRYLELIERPLSNFLRRHPDARLKIVADQRPLLPLVPAGQLDFIQWHPDNEAVSLQAMDVGLMPLADDAWTRGKCSYKMLQYMATALPVVASPVGMNAEVLTRGACGIAASSLDDWSDALELLYTDRPLGVSMGECGRSIVLADFSVPVIARQLADAFSRTLA